MRYLVRAEPEGAACSTSGATHCVMSGLSLNLAYSFSVAAYNGRGALRPAAATSLRALKTPASPQRVVRRDDE